ncbi:MAG: ROK family glucokinase [Clostridiales bacterium]|nr:ROK family glucokinase [Clostridiales bacterium]
MKPYAFGVDIGGTTVKMGLFTTKGKLLDKWEIPTRTERDGGNILPDVAKAIVSKLIDEDISTENVEGIGIGVPGPVDENNTVYRCVNLGWGQFNIRERMNELLPQIPNVAAANDANVAALGELWQGAAKDHKSAVLFTLGTGVGGGVVLNEKIVAGTNGGAGEVGHMTVNPYESVPCGCGKCGCLEQYASANGIVRMAKVMLAASDKYSDLRAMDNFTSKDICDLARNGEEMAMDIVDRCGNYLGRAMSYVSCTLDPEIYVIGGGMSRAGNIVTNSVKRYYHRYAFHVSEKTDVVIAQLGNDAGIYGGAKMVIDG